jgi:hypothetical protein
VSAYDKEGKFNNIQYDNRFPGITGTERQKLRNTLRSWKDLSNSEYDFKKKDIEQENKIKKGNKRYRIPIPSFIDILFGAVLASMPGVFTNIPAPVPWYVYLGYGILLFILSLVKSLF